MVGYPEDTIKSGEFVSESETLRVRCKHQHFVKVSPEYFKVHLKLKTDLMGGLLMCMYREIYMNPYIMNQF